MLNLLYNPFTRTAGSIIHTLRWPFRITLSKIAAFLVIPYGYSLRERLNNEDPNFLSGKCDPDLKLYDCTFSRDLKGYEGISYTISPLNFQKRKNQRSHMIIFMGNTGIATSEAMLKAAEIAKTNHIRITIVQNPGLIHGDEQHLPSYFSDLVDNGEQVVKAIKAQYDLNSDNILLYGHSLGGGVATQVATRFFKTPEDCPHLLADRTFSSVSRVAASWAVGSILNPLFYNLLPAMLFGLISLILSPFGSHKSSQGIQSKVHQHLRRIHDFFALPLTLMISGLIIKPLLLLCGWECHTGLHYALLPTDKKHYLFVREHADILQGIHDIYEDRIIPLFASLDYSVFQKPLYWLKKYSLKLSVKLGFSSQDRYDQEIKMPRKAQKVHLRNKNPEFVGWAHALPLYAMHGHTLKNGAVQTGAKVIEDRIRWSPARSPRL